MPKRGRRAETSRVIRRKRSREGRLRLDGLCCSQAHCFPSFNYCSPSSHSLYSRHAPSSLYPDPPLPPRPLPPRHRPRPQLHIHLSLHRPPLHSSFPLISNQTSLYISLQTTAFLASYIRLGNQTFSHKDGGIFLNNVAISCPTSAYFLFLLSSSALSLLFISIHIYTNTIANHSLPHFLLFSASMLCQ